MKQLIIMITFLFTCSFAFADFTVSNKLFSEYVKNGSVSYSELKKNPTALEASLTELNNVNKDEYQAFSENKKLAWLINLYNVYTIKLIIDNFPTKSIRKLSSPWKQNIIPFFGKTVSLDHIEHSVVRKDFNEPRIHFALVCAAISCPPLRSEAYTASRVQEQLADQEQIFLNNKTKNFVKKNKVYISKIFDWYGDDFKTYGGLNKYLADFYKLEKVNIKYNDYNWDLNGK